MEYEFAISRINIELPEKITFMGGNRKPFSLDSGQESRLEIPIEKDLKFILGAIGTDGLRQANQKTDQFTSLDMPGMLTTSE